LKVCGLTAQTTSWLAVSAGPVRSLGLRLYAKTAAAACMAGGFKGFDHLNVRAGKLLAWIRPPMMALAILPPPMNVMRSLMSRWQ
jgi:hypothetical protein